MRAFVSALLRSVDGEQHYRQLLHLTPTARRITELLHGILDDTPPAVLQERLRLIIGMVCSSVFNRHCSIDDPDADARHVGDALDIATAGLIGLNGREIERRRPGRRD